MTGHSFFSDYNVEHYAFTWTVNNFSKIEYEVNMEINNKTEKWNLLLRNESPKWTISLVRCFDGPALDVHSKTDFPTVQHKFFVFHKAGDGSVIYEGSYQKFDGDILKFECYLDVAGHKPRQEDPPDSIEL